MQFTVATYGKMVSGACIMLDLLIGETRKILPIDAHGEDVRPVKDLMEEPPKTI